jgi:hypothetical protein
MPRVVTTRPSLRSAASASRTASLPTPNDCDSEASEGSAAPGRSSPAWICSRRIRASWRYTGSKLVWSIVTAQTVETAHPHQAM